MDTNHDNTNMAVDAKIKKGRIPWGVQFKAVGVIILEWFVLTPIGSQIGASMGKEGVPGWWTLILVALSTLTWKTMTGKYRNDSPEK